MSQEDAQEPGPDPEAEVIATAAMRKKLNVRPKTRAAMLEVLERRKLNQRPGYKLVAARHGISWQSLKTAIKRYEDGELTLNAPNDPQEMALNVRVETNRALEALDAYEQMLVDSIEGLVQRARDFGAKGKFLSYRDMGLPTVVNDLKSVKALRTTLTKDLLALMREAKREKEVHDAVRDVPSEVVSRVTTEDRAAEVLRLRREQRESAQSDVTGDNPAETDYAGPAAP